MEMEITGTCVYCQKDYKKAGISRHLNAHLKKEPAKPKSASYHLRVEAGSYFLNILVDGDVYLSELDNYLRAIWLECCGHLSEFGLERWSEAIPLSKKIRRIFEKGSSLWYAYDFGSTTELDIRCLDKFPFPVKEGIALLSRNNPLEFLCDKCQKKPATQFCNLHWGEEESSFCDKCAKIHQKECENAADYSLGPIYNSPRTGVCAYEGGQIDLERD